MLFEIKSMRCNSGDSTKRISKIARGAGTEGISALAGDGDIDTTKKISKIAGGAGTEGIFGLARAGDGMNETAIESRGELLNDGNGAAIRLIGEPRKAVEGVKTDNGYTHKARSLTFILLSKS